MVIFGDAPTGSGSSSPTRSGSRRASCTSRSPWEGRSPSRGTERGHRDRDPGAGCGVFTLATTGALANAIATFVFPIFLLWYLNRDKVTAAFNRD
jgi:hypothetical protein